MKSIIKNYLAKLAAGRTDDGIMITLPDPQKIDFQTAMLEDLLMRNGIDPRAITSEKQLVGIINQIRAMEKTEDAAQSGIRNTESAKIFNRAGEELDPSKPIIGGTQEGKKIDQDAFIRLAETNTQRMKQRIADKKIDDDLPPPGSRGGDDDIAAPVQSAEESLKNMIEAENKKNIGKMKNRKMIKDAVDNVSPGFVKGDRKYNAQLVAEELANKKFNKDFYDLDQKQQMDLYGEALDGINVGEDFAKGGIARIGLKDGMNRRTFLKLLTGLAAVPIIGKVLKPLKIGKTVTKVPIIKTADVAGKPEWFDQLVNKVILEGDEVTKRFATKDREIVHMKVLDEGTGGKEFPPGTPGSDDISITVTQDLDQGAVRVEYRNPENMYGDPVQLQYKKPLPDEGSPNPAAEFDTAESIPVARADGPDDYNIDIDEGGGQSIKDLTSDVSKLKEYATGQKPTLKEFVQSKKRKDKTKAISEGGEAESDFIINRQGEEIVEYPEPDFDDAFASGGIARMLGE